MSRLVWLVVPVVVLVAAPPVSANHIAGATYNGTHAQGGTVSFTVTPDGNGLSSFSVGGPVQGSTCSFPDGSSATYVMPLPITNHAFSDTTAPFTNSGTFPGIQSASGTFKIRTTNPVCDSGDVSWTATTTAPPPAPPPPGGNPPGGQPPGGQPPGGQPPDQTAPGLQLGGSMSQPLGGTVAIRAGCPTEACRVTARGTISVPGAARVFRLKAASAQLATGGRATLKPKLGRRALAAARAALRSGRRVRARVTVLAVDSAGNRVSQSRTIRLRLR